MAPSFKSDHTFAWIGRHDVEKHSRQDRHRVRYRRDEGQNASTTRKGADQHRRSQFREELTKEVTAMAII